MSKKHKLFASTATAALVASAIVPVASAANLNDFDSVPAYAQEAVQHLADNNILQGDANGNFNPSQTLTRAQAAEVLAKALKLEATGTEDFSDVKAGDWFYNAVVATSPELFEGDGTGKFNPKAQLTRAQAAKVISVAYNLTGEADLSVFTDVNSVPAWSKGFFAAAVANGVINGKGSALAPNAQISRAEFATMVKRAMDSELTVESVSAINDISVNEGEVASLANTVEVTLSNGTKAQKEVKWDVTGLDTTKPGVYTVKGDVADTDLEASVKVTVVAVAPEVTGVSAINAKELVLTFNKAIKKDTVVHSDGTLVDGVITLTSLDNKAVTVNAAVATLSEDGKKLTLQAQTTEVFEGRYDVAIAKGAFKSTDGKEIEKFETTTGKIADLVAPSITGTTQVTSTQVKINFSEPVNETDAASLLAKASFKYADGTAISSTDITGSVLSDDKKSLTVGLSDADIVVGKAIVVTFIGVKDFAGNIINPNPATATIQKGNKDGVAPTVVEVKAINNKTLEVKFSEELSGNPTVTGVTGNLTYTQDKTDKTKYKVETDAAQSGLKSVTVAAGYSDLSGETGSAFTKVVNFDTDTTAPKLASASVVKGTDNAEYLELTFDEEVTKLSTLANVAVTGTKVKDYVTTNVTVTVPAAQLAVDADNKKVARVKLSDLLSGADVEGAVYDLTLTGKDASATPVTVALFEDISGNDGATSLKASFTRGLDGTAANNNKATINKDENGDTTVAASENGIVVVDNNTLTVMFNGEVDGVTATDVANYQVSGAVVEKAILNASTGSGATLKQTVTLKLKANSNTFTGERNIVISGVKAKNGLAMDTYNTTEILNENVAPTVTKAVLTDVNKIQLTFSEAVTNVLADNNADFELYIGGVKVATNDTITTADQTTAANTLELTLEDNVTADDIAKGLTIKALDTIDIQDTAGNKVVAPVTITVAQ